MRKYAFIAFTILTASLLPATAMAHPRLLSSSPEITSTRTPVRAWIVSTTSSALAAIRNAAVPTAAIARTPCCAASSAMPAIAAIVRSSATSLISPCSESPSPIRDTSARSTTVRHPPSTSRSPTWNLMELVPTSITA